MKNPFVSIVDWIKASPEEHQPDIAAIILYNVKKDALDLLMDSDRMVSNFIDWINSHSAQGRIGLGFVVAFRAYVNFYLIKKRGTKKAWDETREFNRRIREQIKKNDKKHMLDTLNKIEKALPKNEKAWIEICNRWAILLNNELSDSELEKWETEISIAESEKIKF